MGFAVPVKRSNASYLAATRVQAVSQVTRSSSPAGGKAKVAPKAAKSSMGSRKPSRGSIAAPPAPSPPLPAAPRDPSDDEDDPMPGGMGPSYDGTRPSRSTPPPACLPCCGLGAPMTC
jgi:hypothetical protein